MKKTQVALAALALVASTATLANVTVYGAVDAAAAHASGKGTYFDGTGAWTAPSHLGFKGSEDLGSGMKASFQLETGISLNNGAATSGGAGGGTLSKNGFGALMTRVATVGLSGDFGSVTLGQQLSPYIVTQVVGAGAGMGPGQYFVNRMLMSGYGAAAVNVSGATAGVLTSGSVFNYDGFFIPNSIVYNSPSMSGWTFSAMTTTKAGATDGVISTSAASDSYQAYTLAGAIGPVGVGAGYHTRKATSNGKSLYASLPVTSDLTLVANYTKEDATKAGGLEIGSTSIFANYRLSDPLSVQAAYARNDLSTEGTLANLSMKYDLSKRTSVYSIWARGTGGIDPSFANRGAFTFNTAGAAAVTNFTVGVSHSF
jgi:predicted porin